MDYQKICRNEAIALIFVIMINQVLLGSAKDIIMNTASSAWLNTIFISLIALALVFIITKLFKKFINLDIIDISEFIGGNILKIIICIISLAFFILSAVLILYHICDCLEIIYFSNIDILFLQLLFLVGAVICAKKGIAVIAKTNLITVFLLFIPMILLFVALSFNMHFERLFPILGYGFKNTFLDNTTNLYAFSGLIYLFFIMPFLNNSAEFKKIGFVSIIISSVYLFFTVISLLLTFPFSGITEDLLSVYLLSRAISFGSFIERVDAVYVFLWLLSSFSYLSILIFFICNTFKKMTNIKNHNGIIFVTMNIIWGSSLLINHIPVFRFLQLSFFRYFSLSVLGLFIVILLIRIFKEEKIPSKFS